MNLFKKLMGKSAQQPLTLQPQPIEINPTNPAQLKRHIGRLANLYAALARDRSRADVAGEITQRRAAIVAFGHAAPDNEDEARALLAKME
jgi:hypothetical protein